MSIRQLNIYGVDKVQTAIDRLRAFEPKKRDITYVLAVEKIAA